MQSLIMQNLFLFQDIHEPTLKKGVNKLIKIGVLKKVNNSQSASPTYILHQRKMVQ